MTLPSGAARARIYDERTASAYLPMCRLPFLVRLSCLPQRTAARAGHTQRACPCNGGSATLQRTAAQRKNSQGSCSSRAPAVPSTAPHAAAAPAADRRTSAGRGATGRPATAAADGMIAAAALHARAHVAGPAPPTPRPTAPMAALMSDEVPGTSYSRTENPRSHEPGSRFVTTRCSRNASGR